MGAEVTIPLRVNPVNMEDKHAVVAVRGRSAVPVNFKTDQSEAFRNRSDSFSDELCISQFVNYIRQDH